MLSLKKKTETAGPQTPAWHPNFRNFERLPDTKVVRTAFFINGGAMLVALVLLIYFAQSEWQLHSLRSQTDDWQSHIDQDQARSNQAIASYKKFQAEEAKIKEVDAFVKSRPRIGSLIVDLGRTMPQNIAIDSLDLRESTLTLRATVRGAPDKASGYASAYVEALRNTPEFKELFNDVNLTNLSRVASTGRLAIEVVIKLKDQAATGGKK